MREVSLFLLTLGPLGTEEEDDRSFPFTSVRPGVNWVTLAGECRTWSDDFCVSYAVAHRELYTLEHGLSVHYPFAHPRIQLINRATDSPTVVSSILPLPPMMVSQPFLARPEPVNMCRSPFLRYDVVVVKLGESTVPVPSTSIWNPTSSIRSVPVPSVVYSTPKVRLLLSSLLPFTDKKTTALINGKEDAANNCTFTSPLPCLKIFKR